MFSSEVSRLVSAPRTPRSTFSSASFLARSSAAWTGRATYPSGPTATVSSNITGSGKYRTKCAFKITCMILQMISDGKIIELNKRFFQQVMFDYRRVDDNNHWIKFFSLLGAMWILGIQKKSADPGLSQGRGGTWDHRRCGTCFSWLGKLPCSAAASISLPFACRLPAVCLHCPLLLRRPCLLLASLQTFK